MLAESNVMATLILDGIMFEEPGTIPEESPVNDEETWDDEDEMLHGQDDTGPIDSGDDEEEPEEPRKTGHFIPLLQLNKLKEPFMILETY